MIDKNEDNMMKNIKKFFSVLVIALICLFQFTGIHFVTANAAEVYRIQMDKTYLENAVVSDLPVELEGKIINSRNNYVYGKTLVFTVTSGADKAEILNGNELYIRAAGEFTVRASLSDDARVYEDYTCNAVELQFSNVRILSKIENVTVYTQPIQLMGTASAEGVDYVMPIYKEVCFEVVEGPAEIFVGNFLRFTGAGTVVLKAYSRYDADAYVLQTIEVTDPDAGKDVSADSNFQQGDLKAAQGGCVSSTGLGAGMALLLVCAGICLKKKSHN
jgi:hypothetical protein